MKPKIPREILKQLLELCIKRSPFKCPKGYIYYQIEGVAMGSPLGPTFANFYMGDLEERIFNDLNNKPIKYARYVDDIYLQTNNEEEIRTLKQRFEAASVLKFTIELSIENKIPFLDVMVRMNSDSFTTTVYRKPTNMGTCLNGNSDCVDRYKISVINSYINRAFNISNSWEDFHKEVTFIKQMLINNDYSNTLVDNQINQFISRKIEPNQTNEEKTSIPVYYNSQMNQNYKLEERVIKQLIKDNTHCIESDKRLDLIIYYKNMKTCNLVMKNNPAQKPEPLQQNNVVYEFRCPLDHTTDEGQPDVKPQTYIGYTQCTLANRLVRHSYAGSIKEHCIASHNHKPNKQFIKDNTAIISKANDKQRLLIKESILILEKAPTINRQFDHFKHSLKLNPNRSSSHFENTDVSVSNATTANTTSPISTSPSAPPLTPPVSIQEETYNNNRINQEPSNQISNHPLTFNGYISPNITNRNQSLISNSRSSASPQDTHARAISMTAQAHESRTQPSNT